MGEEVGRVISNAYLAARPGRHAEDRTYGFDRYLLLEFGDRAGAWLISDGGLRTRSRDIPLNGGRHGWLAEARLATAKIVAFLLSASSRRASAGRTAPRILPYAHPPAGLRADPPLATVVPEQER